MPSRLNSSISSSFSLNSKNSFLVTWTKELQHLSLLWCFAMYSKAILCLNDWLSMNSFFFFSFYCCFSKETSFFKRFWALWTGPESRLLLNKNLLVEFYDLGLGKNVVLLPLVNFAYSLIYEVDCWSWLRFSFGQGFLDSPGVVSRRMLVGI